MTTEQNLIAALKEAIKEIDDHNGDCKHLTLPSTVNKWLAIPVTCKSCDGHGKIFLPKGGYLTRELMCLACNSTGKRPLSEVI